jgi:hypothetical protein
MTGGASLCEKEERKGKAMLRAVRRGHRDTGSGARVQLNAEKNAHFSTSNSPMSYSN